jgi:integrase
MKDGKSHRTVNKIMMDLKTIINDSVKHDFLMKSPFKGYPELKEEPRPVNYWSKKEILIFLNANKDDYYIDVYKFALNTGLRLGEICGLCWDRVNFESQMITVSRTLTREGLKNTTKTHRARHIPINTTTRDLLLKRFKSKSGKLVFHMEDGRPLTYDHFSQRQFKQAQDRADIGRRIRFHDIRHTYASHFIMNGGDIYVLQKLLGHSDIATTMIYAHLDEGFLKQATEIISF